MSIQIADLANEFGLKPGHVVTVLDDLEIAHDHSSFEVADEDLELIREALREVPRDAPLRVRGPLTPREAAALLGVQAGEVQKTLVSKLRTMATLTTQLKPEVAEKLFELFGSRLEWKEASEPKPAAPKPRPAPKQPAVQKRPPVVTIMGHVDHGKTSLLDKIRKSNVVDTEHGGITQHIGAYQVELPEGKITFIDTPGHEAFTAMRARGAMVTDIAVLVVAADDSVMPQTREAISHAKNAKVPIIVAINKIDLPGVNPDRILTDLTQEGLVPEAFGGDTIVCKVSAHTGEGIANLLEMILLQAEMLQLTADPKGPLEAYVVEARRDKGRGPVATVLVKNGTLRKGQSLLIGTAYGRIRNMLDYRGRPIDEAGPSVPAEVMGLNEVPDAGQKVEVFEREADAREEAERRIEASKSPTHAGRGLTLKGLREKLNQGELKELNLIVRADVQGTVEAVCGQLERIKNDEVQVRIIHRGVGNVTRSDVDLADTATAICVGFNVSAESDARNQAKQRGVEIRTYRIIYELKEDIEKAIQGMLEPKFEEQRLGAVEIRMVFDLSRYGKVAGCYVTEGKVVRGCQVRVRRGSEVVYEGRVASLRHLKDDVREMTAGFECGIQFDGWTGFQEGDVIEAFERVQV
ncbi:MAG: translation initiation factor IF-2 [Fimbriimonadales bacterium]|nr:translation initiation factor IF-2 [Fimbriimonadales bacterium]